ncbi:hypothetical protein PGT21_029215 [Puccinia graminis f. sp. tritici]|uniref:Uncharacterized protein n=1 Tax=Puccinia graminis f. sp. tritici TaxID=56615 RepID=A0A5B0MFC0_PUCGR|nr:hypothetical protein PGTUg99_025621 [Puccinia graminis f. sp. tritici]KAA1091228.1 hypothetical protein PGT21_029215 [Puccinia graminis f. sp. tritici]
MNEVPQPIEGLQRLAMYHILSEHGAMKMNFQRRPFPIFHSYRCLDQATVTTGKGSPKLELNIKIWLLVR